MTPQAPPLVSGKGARVALGPLLGRGGEGIVYQVKGHPQLAAKLYHRAVPEALAEKLTAMVASRDAELMRICAWPLDVLKTSGGPQELVVGLILPRLTEHSAIHLLYSPRDRLRIWPRATWRTLIDVAIEVARVFRVMHRKGQIIGDINPNNLLINPDGGVRLIDTDSFQITLGAATWPCTVGAAEFLPPELQGARLAEVERTVDQDRFGLAVLLFHLLFLGRHPYAGAPRITEEGVSLDTGGTLTEAIRKHRFAYGPGAEAMGVQRPPHAPPLTLLPPRVAALFEQAFAPDAAEQRPSAGAWIKGLEALLASLRTCGRDEAHVYPETAWGCPWCTLQDRLGQDLFSPLAPPAPFDARAVQAQIEAIAPLPSSPDIAAEPVPPDVPEVGGPPGAMALALSGAALAGGGAFVEASARWGLLGLGGAIGLAGGLWWMSRRNQAREALRSALESRLVGARAEARAAMSEWQGTGARFSETRAALIALLEEPDPEPSSAEISQRLEEARLKALEHHLSAFRLDQARIPSLNQRRLGRLRHAGVETAADLRRSVLKRVSNFGDKLISRLLNWRAEHERGFVFDVAEAREAIKEATQASLRLRREGRLRDGPRHLERLAREAGEARRPIEQKLVRLQGEIRGLEGRLKRLGGPVESGQKATPTVV